MRDLPPAFAAALPARYQLGAPIAEGGQAVVVAARDLTLQRDVALKLLPRADASAVAIGRFEREVALLAELAHPHIIPILDAGETAGVLWYAMPRIHGPTLAERIRQGPIPEATVRRWGAELAGALAAAHRRGVVHRDVKPANVYLVDDHALLADFGVASLAADDELTATGEAVGTARYMSAEQRAGAVDATVDVHGLGATLIEASSGARWEPTAPTWSAVPRGLRPVLQRAVGHGGARWPSADAFGAALATSDGRAARRALVGAALVTAAAAVAWVASPAAPPRRYAVDLALASVGDADLANRLVRAAVTRLEWFPPLAVAPWGQADVGEPAWRVESTVETSRRGTEALLTIRHAGGRTAVLRVPGDSTDLPRWASAVAESVVTVVSPERHLEFTSYAGGAHSGRALWLYYDAEEAFDHQEWGRADSLFRAAAAVDAGFVQARWGAMQARKWGRLPYADDLNALAATLALPPPYDALVMLQREPDLRRRLDGLDALAEAWPRVAAVQLTRANELFHRGPLVGRPLASALTALEAAAATFPSLDRPVVWDHVVWGAVRLGDERRARTALAARRRSASAQDDWGLLLRYATESRFRPAVGRVLGVAIRLNGEQARATVRQAFRLAITLDLPEVELRLADWLDTPAPGGAEGSTTWSARALSLLLAGRPLASLHALDSAAALDPNNEELARQRWEWRLQLPAAGVPIPEAEQARARVALSSGDEGPFGRALEHLREARGRLAAGDTAAALLALGWHEHSDLQGWPAGAPQSGEVDAALSAVARWRRGGLLVATGRTDEGCRLRARALALWHDAEPGFVEAIRAGEPESWERACRR